jgi:hypothetical protein
MRGFMSRENASDLIIEDSEAEFPASARKPETDAGTTPKH